MKATLAKTLPKEIIRYIEEISKESNIDEESVFRSLLMKAINIDRRERAIEKYSCGELSITQASELANLPISSFIDILIERNIKGKISSEMVKEGLKNLKEILK
jgi:predicted HTH domain antitoxin